MSPSKGQVDGANQYRKLFADLWRRTADPIQHPTFVIYFIVVMVVISPLSIWVELYSYLAPTKLAQAASPATTSDGIRTALLTFFPAVAAGTALQFVWASDKGMRAFAILVFTGLAVMAALVMPSQVSNAAAIKVGIVATIVTLWLWWIANAMNSELLADVSPAASVGGEDPTRKLPGNLTGFEY